MKAKGMVRQPRKSPRDTAGARQAQARLAEREVRSYEVEQVNGLWHLDFHVGSLRVLTHEGEWVKPCLYGSLDDASRVVTHAQWYWAETAENLVHGLSQGLQKWGLPRALMSDNGPAETALEVVGGLQRLGIVHELTLPYSPYQNGKQESFWGQVEGRLLAMLAGCKDLTLAQLNEATQAWVQLEYNHKVHSELGESPLERWKRSKDAGRASPASDELRQAFMAQVSRTQRRSDGTVSLEGKRLEVPGRYRHLERVYLRYAQWDLSQVYLVDEREDTVLCRLYPLDKARNAQGLRRALASPDEPAPAPPAQESSPGMAPLLKKLLADYAATGLPPAYLPKDERLSNPEEETK
jgi:putative transposase